MSQQHWITIRWFDIFFFILKKASHLPFNLSPCVCRFRARVYMMDLGALSREHRLKENKNENKPMKINSAKRIDKTTNTMVYCMKSSTSQLWCFDVLVYMKYVYCILYCILFVCNTIHFICVALHEKLFLSSQLFVWTETEHLDCQWMSYTTHKDRVRGGERERKTEESVKYTSWLTDWLTRKRTIAF